MQNRLRRYIISGFATVAAFSGLITTAHLLFTSTAFYLAVTVCFLLAICCVVAWQKTERTKYVKQSLHAIFVRLSENVDSEAVIGLNEIVVYYGMKDEVANTLGEMICTKPDPTERYWLYIALGMMGGKKAESIIENSLADDNEFARNGAVEAQKLLRNPKRRTRKRDKLLFSYFGEYISSVVTLSLCAVIIVATIYHKNLSSKYPLTTQVNTPVGVGQRQRIPAPNIITIRGNGGDIVINICNGKREAFEISFTISHPILYIKMGR